MKIVTTIIITTLFYGLAFFRHHILLYTEGGYELLLFALTAILYIIIVVNFLRYTSRLLFKEYIDKKEVIRPLIIYALILLLFHLNPIKSSEIFRSPVEEFACYEGTINTAVLKLRKNKTFEIGHSGFFSYTISCGTYSKSADTLILNFNNKKINYSNKYINSSTRFLPIDTPLDDSKFIYFYKGHCLGLN